MSKIRFLDTSTIYSVILSYSDARITLIFDDYMPEIKDILMQGFEEINEHNDFVQGDYRCYKYIYREIPEQNTFILTARADDIYVESEFGEEGSDGAIEPDPYIPSLTEIRERKINSFSNFCNQMIVQGMSIEIDGTIEHFSYTESDQTNIKELFDTVLSTGLPVYYHADNMGCKPYTASQIISIYIAQATNKTHHTTYFNQLKLYINSLNDVDLISNLEYGVTELTGEYLDTYNSALTQAELNITAYLAKFGANLEANN